MATEVEGMPRVCGMKTQDGQLGQMLLRDRVG